MMGQMDAVATGGKRGDAPTALQERQAQRPVHAETIPLLPCTYLVHGPDRLSDAVKNHRMDLDLDVVARDNGLAGEVKDRLSQIDACHFDCASFVQATMRDMTRDTRMDTRRDTRRETIVGRCE